MQGLRIGLVWLSMAVGGLCHAAEDAGNGLLFELRKDQTVVAKHPWAKLENVKVTSIAGVSRKAIDKMNKQLDQLFKHPENRVRNCVLWALGEPWKYQRNFYHIHRAKDYLSVVFEEIDGCRTTVTRYKEVHLFSLSNGASVGETALLRAFVPSMKRGHSSDAFMHTVMRDEAAQRLIADSEAEMGSRLDRRCLPDLKVQTYYVWTKDQYLVFYPAYQKLDASCQREYVVKWDK